MATIKELAEALRGCDPGLRSEIAREAWATARRWRRLAARLGVPNDQALALHGAAAAEAVVSSGAAFAAAAEAMGVPAAGAHYWARRLGVPPRPKASKWDGGAARRDAEAARVHGMLERGMSAAQIMAKMRYATAATVYKRRDRHLAALARDAEARRTGGEGGG